MFQIPQKLRLYKALQTNYIRQLLYPSVPLEMTGITDWVPLHGRTIFISKTKVPKVPEGFHDSFSILSDGKVIWSDAHRVVDPKWRDLFSARDEALASRQEKLVLIEEARDGSGQITRNGLRTPQIGAIYSALGRLRMSSDVATIVLPTGTGKTDCMISLAAILPWKCVLVVVPTDALRRQIADNFLSFGVLVKFGLLPIDIAYPVVGVLKTTLDSGPEIKTFCNACNVIVATMPLMGHLSDAEQSALAQYCDALFIDEAHHVTAKTWSKLRSHFSSKPILQFTATPYRNDRKHVDGDVIFDYPLKRAQDEGYFTKLVLKELYEIVDGDKAVAELAITQLTSDLSNKFDHIIMARADGIDKAERLKLLYDELAPSFVPVIVHSRLTRKVQRERIAQLNSRQSRIAICVDMFGEGFDFPELKIAALHDIHQSLSVTIQFVGRFARAKASVGSATIIVNRADTRVDHSVSALYAESGNADWNVVLPTLTETANAKQAEKQDFFDNFKAASQPTPIQNVRPKMSAVVYQTQIDEWEPFAVKHLNLLKHALGQLSVNLRDNTAFFVIKTENEVEWAESSRLFDRNHDLYLLYWDRDTRLLYINSSNNDSVHEDIAMAVGGPQAKLIKDLDAFRVLDGIKRLLLRNMGLNDRLRRSVRFVMYTGADIRNYLTTSQLHGKEKTHIFADGYDGTKRLTIGTSKKGRIWSWQEAHDIVEWKQWCVGVGKKLTDSSITHDAFLKEMMVPEDITGPPSDLFPITIEWPDELYRRGEESISIGNGAISAPFFDVGFDLIDPERGQSLNFNVGNDQFSAEYQLLFEQGRDAADREMWQAVYHSNQELFIFLGKKRFLLSEYFGFAHPIIRYEKDCWSRGDQLFRPQERHLTSFDTDRMLTWAWNGIDLTKESQGVRKRVDSIQYKTIQMISSTAWDRQYEIIFDDDSSGEAADVVALSVDSDNLHVDLFHCKYTNLDPGKRVSDLYVVCGQAVRSGKWQDHIERFLSHLVNRERSRMQKSRVSRFERGELRTLLKMRALAHTVLPQFRVFVVQPGVQKQLLTPGQKDLLGSTENYLNDLRGIKFGVICS
jgi:superfamily II DNA or RNA helicase